MHFNPGADIGVEHFQRYGAFTQHLVVKCADIEFLTQFFFGVSPQFLDLEFAYLVRKGLARLDDITIYFNHNVVLRLAGVGLEEIYGLLT